jgi:hypothetical protein
MLDVLDSHGVCVQEPPISTMRGRARMDKRPLAGQPGCFYTIVPKNCFRRA